MLKSGGIIILLFVVSAGSPALGAQDAATIERGTVNIALANSNGIVLLTDSVQSHQDGDGWHFTQPVQKLFRLDDETVCSIAGFASETGWSTPQLNTDVAGIIATLREQLVYHPLPELDGKLRAIGYLVGYYIDLIANRREVVTGPGTPAASYEFQVIVAGYDADGQPGIEKLVLNELVQQVPGGPRVWSHTTSVEVTRPGTRFTSVLGGIQEISLAVLNHPEQFNYGAAIFRYAESKNSDGGESLTISELKALASEMAGQTARRTPFVGGPDQVAILAQGKILALDQPTFDDPPRPMKFGVLSDLRLEGQEMIFAVPGTNLLWLRSQFVWSRDYSFDGQFFYGCEIRDSMVRYSGGLMDFGPSNTVVNSMLLPGSVAVNGFEWSRQPPDIPRVPSRMLPRRDEIVPVK